MLCVLVKNKESLIYGISVFSKDFKEQKIVLTDLPRDSEYFFSQNILTKILTNDDKIGRIKDNQIQILYL